MALATPRNSCSSFPPTIIHTHRRYAFPEELPNQGQAGQGLATEPVRFINRHLIFEGKVGRGTISSHVVEGCGILSPNDIVAEGGPCGPL